MSPYVAIITGAASGMGLELTKHLLSQSDKEWRVAVADVQSPPNELLSNSSIFFRKVDITDYSQQAYFFHDVFDWGGGRIDFFAANAGIDDRQNIITKPKDMKLRSDGVPEPLDEKVLDINLNAVVQGIWLFRFFSSKRQVGRRGGKIIITASTAGLYPMPTHPLYSAAKHGLIGLTRSVSHALEKENISINAICPAMVDTPLLPKKMREIWPKEHITPMSTIIRAHDRFLHGDETGRICEVSQNQMYLREPPEYANDSQRWMMEESGVLMKKVLLSLYQDRQTHKL